MNNIAWIVNMSEGLTNNYHSGGSALIIAKNLEDAHSIFNLAIYDSEHEGTWTKLGSIESESKVYIFPNKGCC